MSAHTPGPWTTEHGLIYSPEGHTVASCVDEDGEFCHPSEGPHDARLIAAAPDLLEALRDLVEDITDRFNIDAPSTNPGMRDCVRVAQAAIAKATQP